MLQDIAPSRYRVEYADKQPEADSPCFVFRGREVLEARRNGDIVLPRWEELEPFAAAVRYLFRIDDREFFLADLAGEQTPAGYEWQDYREGQKQKPKAFHFAETTAYHLYVWYRDNRFCGRCGGKTEQDKAERMLRCPACGNMIYPKIAPAVIVALTDGDRIMMTRYRGRPYKGYALIAGFNEIGETMEDTVRREIMEEVGLHCKDIRYCGSQPWGTESNLLLGYFARLDGEASIRLDRQELSEAEWLDREEIDIPADGYSLTNHMIQLFRRGEEPS